MGECTNFEEILPNIFTYVIVDENFTSDEKFTCTLRVKLTNEAEFFQWLRSFEELTNTNWNFRRSKAESNKFVFSRDYVCHHSDYNKQKQDENSILGKNKACGAKLSVRIKWNTKDVRYKDKYVKEGYMGVINISFVHSHAVSTAESLHWLKRDPEMKDIFIDYFNKGLSPSEARMHHEDNLLSEEPHEIVNSRINPPKQWVYKLHNKWLLNKFGDLKGGENFLTASTGKAEVDAQQGC